MFSFFKKKKDPFTVRIKEYEQPRFVAGMQTPTTKRSYRKDVSALQTSFNGKRDQLQNRTNPSGTMVIFSLPDSAGSFTYFVGDLVDTAQQADCFVVRELPAGKYAHISIDFKVPTDLPLKMAKQKNISSIPGCQAPATRCWTASSPASCTTAAARLRCPRWS